MILKCPFLVDVIGLTQIGPNICKIPRGASKLFDVFIDVLQQHLKLIGGCRGLNPLHYFVSNLWDFWLAFISRNNRWVILIFLMLVNRYPKKEKTEPIFLNGWVRHGKKLARLKGYKRQINSSHTQEKISELVQSLFIGDQNFQKIQEQMRSRFFLVQMGIIHAEWRGSLAKWLSVRLRTKWF